jgi:hypothetical protein
MTINIMHWAYDSGGSSGGGTWGRGRRQGGGDWFDMHMIVNIYMHMIVNRAASS